MISPPYHEPTEPSLEVQMVDDPIATAPIYADWLQLQGHPRGALIATQLAGLSDEQLLADHAEVFLGPMARWSRPDPDGNPDQPAIELAWHAGFLSRVKILGRSYDHTPERLLREVLRHPSTRFLRELVIGCTRGGDQHNEAVTAALLSAWPAPPLRSLYLADFDDSEYDGIDLSRAPIGDLRGLGALYPRLEHVILKGRGDLLLDDLELPRAKHFALRTSTMTKLTLATILNAPWPDLEELELWFGDPDRGYGAECTAEDVRPLFGKVLPQLTTLRLMNTAFTDELVPMLAAWSGAARLRDLDFGLGALTDSGAAELAMHRDRFPALERLGVFECSLLPAGLASLASFPVDASAIAGAHAIGAPRNKAGNRYSSVNE